MSQIHATVEFTTELMSDDMNTLLELERSMPDEVMVLETLEGFNILDSVKTTVKVALTATKEHLPEISKVLSKMAIRLPVIIKCGKNVVIFDSKLLDKNEKITFEKLEVLLEKCSGTTK